MSDTLTPDQQVEMIRMALAEYGYGDVEVWWEGGSRESCVATHSGSVPSAVWWTACDLLESVSPAPEGFACWPCWTTSVDTMADCEVGNCAHPDQPRKPPTELLVRGGGR